MTRFLICSSTCRKVDMLSAWNGSKMIRLSESIEKDQKEIRCFLITLRITIIREPFMEQNSNSCNLFSKMDWGLLGQMESRQGKDIYLRLLSSIRFQIGERLYLYLLVRFMLLTLPMLGGLCRTIGCTAAWLKLWLKMNHTHSTLQLFLIIRLHLESLHMWSTGSNRTVIHILWELKGFRILLPSRSFF